MESVFQDASGPSTREFCVNQYCIVMHGAANVGIGRPGNTLINKSLYFTILDF